MRSVMIPQPSGPAVAVQRDISRLYVLLLALFRSSQTTAGGPGGRHLCRKERCVPRRNEGAIDSQRAASVRELATRAAARQQPGCGRGSDRHPEEDGQGTRP